MDIWEDINELKRLSSDLYDEGHYGLSDRVDDIVAGFEASAKIGGQVFGQWIKVSDRLPTKDDADEFGKVLLYRKTNEEQKQLSKSIYDWAMVKYCEQDTYWSRIIPLPKP